MGFETKYRRVRFETTGWTGPEMAQAAADFIKDGLVPRIGLGRTVHDMPTPPLKPKYAEFKRRRGRKPIRNLTNTGRTMRSMKVLSAAPNTAKIGFTDAETNKRVWINQRVSRVFGVSPADTNVLMASFNKLPSPVKIVPAGMGKK